MAPARLHAVPPDDLRSLDLVLFEHLPPPPPSPSAAAVPLSPASAGGGGADRVARLGLVLSVALALVGSVCALGRADDDTTTTAVADVAIHEPAPDDPGDTSAVEVPAVVLPEGFHGITGDGISLAVPEDWTTVDPADLRLSSSEMRELYPDVDVAVLKAATAMVDKGAIFMAIDMSGDSVGSNVNVLSVPVALPIDEIESALEAGFEGTGFDVGDTSSVDHPLGQVYRVAVAMTVGGLDIEAVQFYVPVDGETYIVTVTGASSTVADQIVQSFRVDDSSV